jgi:hypothetical protein
VGHKPTLEVLPQAKNGAIDPGEKDPMKRYGKTEGEDVHAEVESRVTRYA